MNGITGKVNSINKGMEKDENLTCSDNVCGWLHRMHLFAGVGRLGVAGKMISYNNIEAI